MNLKKNLKFILLFGDIFLIYIALLLALAIRYGDFSFWFSPKTKIFLFHFSILGILWLILLFTLDFYETPSFRKIFDFFHNLIIFLFLAGVSGVIYFYLPPRSLINPKTILFLDVLIFGLFLCGWRYLFNLVLKLQNFKEKIVIIGFRPEFRELFSGFSSRVGYEISAFFDYNSSLSNQLTFFSNLAKYGVITDIPKLKEVIVKEKVNSIIFAFDFYKDEKLAQQIFSNLPFRINYISFVNFYESLIKKVPLESINEIWFLENISRGEKRIEEILKRGFDIVFSSLGLLITIILFPFIALAIKIDSPGPVFFLQKRVGKDGKAFTLYKFRSMKMNKTQDKELWKEKDSNQITKLGNFLRKTHLDELPQFVNILKGDLSFVGPRPEWVELAKIFEKEIPFYPQRYLIKPGFTGWTQLNYVATTSIEGTREKLQYDLYYIKNRSFLFDLEIILKTVRIIFR